MSKISLVYDSQRILVVATVQRRRIENLRNEIYFQLVRCERSMSAADRYRLTMINDLKKASAKKRATTVKQQVNDNSAAPSSQADGNKRWWYCPRVDVQRNFTRFIDDDGFFFSIPAPSFSSTRYDQEQRPTDLYPTTWTMKLCCKL